MLVLLLIKSSVVFSIVLKFLLFYWKVGINIFRSRDERIKGFCGYNSIIKKIEFCVDMRR